MRNFVKLSPNYWTGATGRALRKAGPEAQLVALYLLSSPHTNYIGLYRLPLAYAASDLGMPAERLRELLALVAAAGFAGYDEPSETVWIYEAARHQIGELNAKDKVIGAVQREFESLPNDCPYLAAFLDRYTPALHLKLRKGMAPHQQVNDATPVQVPARSEEAVQPVVPITTAHEAPGTAAPKICVPMNLAEDFLPSSFADYALKSALERLMFARQAANLSEPEDDRELVSRVFEIAHADGSPIANRMLETALAAHDYMLLNLKQHRAEAVEQLEI